MTKEYKTVKLSELTPYAKNPRKNDEAVPAVKESINQCGYINPIVVDENYEIMAGHTRYKALRENEADEVEVLVVSGLTDAQKRKYRLLDNKSAEAAEWDFDLLAEELDGLDFEGFDFGFDIEEPESIDDIIEDEAPEPPEEPKAKLGDIYQLGDHRIMCGDSTDAEAVDKLMNGDKAVFVFTDPPYGVAIGSKNAILNGKVGTGGGRGLAPDARKGPSRIETDIENDTLDFEELFEMLKPAFENLRNYCRDDCSYYVTSPQGGDLYRMMMMMMEAGLKVRHVLIWVKNIATFSLGRLDYDYRHEPIFYTWTDKHNFYGGYSNTVIDDSTPIDKMTKTELKDLVRALKQDKDDSVIYCDKPVASKLHPTMKPIKLIARFMVNSSLPGDKVLDIFGGSGSTLIAAEQLNRKCYMMELDPHYVDVIIERWENFTGQKAVLLNA